MRRVKVVMVQNFSCPGRTFDVLLKFREPCFQISLVKIPSYNNMWWPSGYVVSRFPVKLIFFRAVDVSAWGGIYTTLIMI